MKLSHIFISVFLTFLSTYACTPKQQTADKDASANHVQVQVQVPVSVKDISAEAALDIYNQNDQNIVFLDVRTPEEIAQGTLDRSMKLDFRNKEFKNQIVQLDKTKSYIVYCKSGGRSSQATDFMIENGFKDVTNVLGGYTELSQLNKQ